MEAAKERPAYVTFDLRQIEDRAASQKVGHYVGQDVIYALITPPGSKDRIERVADEWVQQNFQQAREGRLPQEWAQAYADRLKAFKEGRELPEDGTPILTWPAISPAQQKAILDADVRTVEDLANANESTLVRIGMGGRALKQKAEAWLTTSKDVGAAALRMETLTRDNIALKARNEVLEAENIAYKAAEAARLEALAGE